MLLKLKNLLIRTKEDNVEQIYVKKFADREKSVKKEQSTDNVTAIGLL